MVVRDNGQTTYFASDITYHMDKLERVRRVINVWGADHHGYRTRQGSLAALGEDPDRLDIEWVQFANLFENGEKMQMSTRSGEYVTLRQLREDVGRDAARFFYVMRKNDQHLDFDLDLAKSRSKDNPVYYVQYAHARVHSVFRRAGENGEKPNLADADLSQLAESHERALMQTLERSPNGIEVQRRMRHQLAHYLRDVATAVHSWYDAHRMLVDDIGLRDATGAGDRALSCAMDWAFWEWKHRRRCNACQGLQESTACRRAQKKREPCRSVGGTHLAVALGLCLAVGAYVEGRYPGTFLASTGDPIPVPNFDRRSRGTRRGTHDTCAQTEV